MSYGYRINDYLNVGLGVSYLFGTIKETERIDSGTDNLVVQETNRYYGGRVDIGIQGKITDRFVIGVRWQLPTSLSGRRDRTVAKSTGLANRSQLIENTSDVVISNFDLPLEIGTGLSFKAAKSVRLNADYTKSYWSATNQDDNIGDFIDRNRYAFGAEYLVDEASFKFWERMAFRVGANYDSGYLRINRQNINSYSITTGLGIPIGRSRLNLSYSYRGSGSNEGILVQETFNTINLNISLRDIWFLRRKIN